MADGKSAPSVGELIAANYQILGTAGAGGMGVVYRALDLRLQRNVALKFLPAELNDSERDKERFLREARTASSLDHPNVGVIYSIEETPDQRSFIAMAYYEGKSLAQKIRSGPLSPAEATDIAIQMLKGLEHAHSHGIEHRDIKPSNIMLTQDGMVKIVDFGLAHVSQQTASKTHGISGTVAYMSPEQTLGRPVDTKSDIWAAGIVMVEMLTGQNPFARETIPATAIAIINEAPAIPEGMPQELQSVIYRALSKDPLRRYPQCADMLRDLEALRPGLPETAVATAKKDHNTETKSSRRVRESSQFRRSREWASASAWAQPQPRTNWTPWLLGFSGLAVLVVAALVIAPVRQRIVGVLPASWTGGNKQAAYEGYLAALGYIDRYDVPGNLDKAIEALNGSLKIDPLSALAYAQLGEAYRMKYQTQRDNKWLDLALENCQKAEELDNRIPSVYSTLARIHDDQGKTDLAVQEYQQALDINPRDIPALQGMASYQQRTGHLQEAEDGYKKAAALRPDDWGGYNDLGGFYDSTGKSAQAIEAYKQAVQLSPDNTIALSNLGASYWNSGDPKFFGDAERALRKSLDVRPNYAAYANLAALYLQQKRFAESAAMSRSALALNDQDYLVWDNLRTAYDWLRDHGQSELAASKELPLLRRRILVKSQDGLAHGILSTLYAKKGEASLAEAETQTALALNGDDPQVLQSVADTWEVLGDEKRAMTYLLKAKTKGATADSFATDIDIQPLLGNGGALRAAH